MLNARAEHDRLIEALKGYGAPVVAGFEATGDYHRALAWRLGEAGFTVRLISSVALARTREALHNGWDKNDPKDAQVILHMLRLGLSQRFYDPLGQGINDLQELSKTHDAISRMKTETLHRILTHYLPLYFPEIERFRHNSRSDWFFAFLERFSTPASITALDKEAFIAATWEVVGRKVSKARLLGDIYETARSSIALPVLLDSPAITMFRLILAEMRSLIRQRDQIEAFAERLLAERREGMFGSNGLSCAHCLSLSQNFSGADSSTAALNHPRVARESPFVGPAPRACMVVANAASAILAGIAQRAREVGMSVDLVRFGPYMLLAHTGDDWYERVSPSNRGISIYDLSRHVSPNREDVALKYELLDPRTQSFEIFISYYCVAFNRFTFCDVGAHYGSVAMDFARLIKSNGGNVDMFAFDAGVASELTFRNFENNGFAIAFEQAAVGSMDGHVPVFIAGEGGTENNRLVNGRGSDAVPRRCIKLDTYLKQAGCLGPACIKIDVQGAEPAVLMGMSELMEIYPVTIQMECVAWAMRESGVDPVGLLSSLLEKNFLFDVGHSRQRMIRVEDAAGAVDFIDSGPPYWTDLLIVPRSLAAEDSDIMSRILQASSSI